VIDDAGKARIWSRNHLPLEPKFPTIGDAVSQLNLRSTILDGEIVALDSDGIPRFQLLQQWQKRPTAIQLSTKCIQEYRRSTCELLLAEQKTMGVAAAVKIDAHDVASRVDP
jgi:hypothetical protein